MSDKMLIVQIQGITMPTVARATHNLIACVASLVPAAHWQVDVDEAEGLCNIQISSRDPVVLWGAIHALISLEPPSSRSLARRWIVVCEGKHSWSDYMTLAHFDISQIDRASPGARPSTSHPDK